MFAVSLWGPGAYDEYMSSISPCESLKGTEMGVSQNNNEKDGPCQCLDGLVKEPYKMFMVLGARP